jgi:hypothetical protein
MDLLSPSRQDFTVLLARPPFRFDNPGRICYRAWGVSDRCDRPADGRARSADWFPYAFLVLCYFLAMIRLTCPHCQSKINAKDDLAGQTRKCPKCAQPIRIVADPPAPSDVASEAHVVPPDQQGLPTPHVPERLDRDCHYLVLSKTHLVASWENNGHGWMLKLGPGFVSARRNRDKIPAEGSFVLVELQFTMTDEGKRLSGVVCYELASRWALTALSQGDDQIVEKIANPGELNRDQKGLVREALREHYMRPVWEGSAAIFESLANPDDRAPDVAPPEPGA